MENKKTFLEIKKKTLLLHSLKKKYLSLLSLIALNVAGTFAIPQTLKNHQSR